MSEYHASNKDIFIGINLEFYFVLSHDNMTCQPLVIFSRIQTHTCRNYLNKYCIALK